MGPGVAVGGGLGLLVLVVIVTLMGGDPSAILQQGGGGGGSTEPLSAEEQELGEFVSTVLRDTEQVWGKLFRAMGRTYEEPKLVLFRGSVQSACGMAGAAVGPFYCPADRKAYIDLSFYKQLRERFAAPGDFAQAYVIAHEVGHHVQNLLGYSDRIRAAQARTGERERNALSVRLELHADFLAGVWAHHAHRDRHVLEDGDVEEALGAASAIGDDTLQRKTQGEVSPDSFTHGSSAQRVAAFRKGLHSGRLADGDTFEDLR
jgi:predicted metalloprotease